MNPLPTPPLHSGASLTRGSHDRSRRRWGLCALLTLATLTSGCATRPVAPPVEGLTAVPWGAIDARTHDVEGDALVSEGGAAVAPTGDGSRYAMLALSGGGSRGAFGAGLLAGWTKKGDRPEFRVVTGVSTGALMATYVFLGSRYDYQLERFFTTTTNKMVFSGPSYLGALFGSSLMNTAPLQKTLLESIPDAIIDEVAVQHRRGRRLYVATTNLDGNRLTTWDMGAIAASTRPERYTRYREVLRASAAIPIAFPPVYFPVQVNGKEYWQMHVDGGVAANVFFSKVMLEIQGRIGRTHGIDPAAAKIDFYVILNGPLEPAPIGEPISPSLFSIANGATWTTSWSSELTLLSMLYQGARQRGYGYWLAGIPTDYPGALPVASFDPPVMTRLFRYAEALGQQGYRWQDKPPLAVEP